MILPIPPLNQKDNKWKDKKLGTSTVSTIGGYGCLLTCATMCTNYFGKNTDPSKLNDDMVKAKGFYNGSYWLWGQLSAVYPDINFDWDIFNEANFEVVPADMTIIDKLLEQKIPAIVKVDFTPGGDVQDHWVLVVGKDNDYFINDPWTGETYYFTAKYGDPKRYIYNIRAYRGPIPVENYKLFYQGVEIKTYDKLPDDIISDLQTKLNQANESLAVKITEADTYRNTLAKADSDNKDLANQLGSARQERDKALSESKGLVSKVEELERGIVTSQAEIKRLSEALVASTSLELANIKTRELARELLKRLFRK